MRRYKLKEISKIYNGSTPSTLDIENYDGNIIWITPKDLSNQKCKYITQGERNITEKGYNSCSTTMLPKGTILLSSRAPIGLLAVAQTELCTNQGFKNIVPNNELIDNNYLYYLLSLKIKEIEALGSGTTFKEVSKTSLENYQIDIHDLDIQHKIANALNVIDDKIILNNKINQELEQMAKTLYDYWFVQFDFPDEKGRPYKSANGKMVYNEVLKREIPVGWEVGTLCDICKITRGVSYDKKVVSDVYLNGFTPIFRANNIDNGHINYDSLVFVPNDLISNSQIIRKNDVIMTMSSGSLNHLGKTYKSKTDMNYSYGAFCSKITPSNNYRHYLSSFLSSLSFQIYIKNMCLGTNINNLNNEHIYSAPICIPNTSLLDRFNSITDTIFSMIGKNEQENVELVEIRDFLLPLLMNGQVTVSSER